MPFLLDTVVTLFFQDSSVPYNGFRVYLSYPPARQDRQSLRRVHLHLPFEAQPEGKGHAVAAPSSLSSFLRVILTYGRFLWTEGIRREMKCCLRQIDKKCPGNARDAFLPFFVRWFTMATKTPGGVDE